MKKYIINIALVVALFPTFALAQTFERDLNFGVQNNSDVTKLQEFLTEQGIYSGPITGNFFSLTLKAVKNFQIREGISPAAGYFGPKTRTRASALLDPQITASNQQAIGETGSVPTQQASTQNSNAILQAQIDILIKQLAQLQQQTQTQQNIQNQPTQQYQAPQQTVVTPSNNSTPSQIQIPPAITQTQSSQTLPSVIQEKPEITITLTSDLPRASYVINWIATNADYCELPGLRTNKFSSQGSITVTPKIPTTYSVSCNNAAGTSLKTLTLSNRYTPLSPVNIGISLPTLLTTFTGNTCQQISGSCATDSFNLIVTLPADSNGDILGLKMSLISEFSDNYYLNQLKKNVENEFKVDSSPVEYLDYIPSPGNPVIGTAIKKVRRFSFNGTSLNTIFTTQLANFYAMHPGDNWRYKLRLDEIKILDTNFGEELTIPSSLESDWITIVK